MASSRPSAKHLDLDITIVSAKHLKNVNWRHGDLKPYVAFWLEPGRRFTTKPDDSATTRPVWNERFLVPVVNSSLHDTLLSLEISHFDSPTPLVGSLQFPLRDLLPDSNDSNPIRTLELRRPSGRPQGKIRLKLGLREREHRPIPSPPSPDYHYTPQHSYYYSSAPPPPTRYLSPPSPYAPHFPPPAAAASPALPPPPSSPSPYSSYSNDPYYYPGYYSHPPPPPPRPFLVEPSYSSPTGPSAPVDYSSPFDHKPKVIGYSSSSSSYDHKPKVIDYSSPYEHKPKGSKMGLGTGLAVGAVAGALGGLTLDEGLKYEDNKIAERVENDLAARDDYSDYRANY